MKFRSWLQQQKRASIESIHNSNQSIQNWNRMWIRDDMKEMAKEWRGDMKEMRKDLREDMKTAKDDAVR